MQRQAAEGRITIDQIVRRTLALLETTWIEALFSIVLLTGLRVWLANIASAALGDGVNIVTWVVSVVIQCELTRRLLLNLGYPGVRRRYGPMLAIGIATGIPLVIGFVLLALPGLYMLARWAICDVVLLAENTGGAESISTSWERTRSNVPPIMAALILAYVPSSILGSILLGLTAPFGFSWVFAFAALPTQIAWVLGWYVAVAVYHELRPQTRELEQIFA